VVGGAVGGNVGPAERGAPDVTVRLEAFEDRYNFTAEPFNWNYPTKTSTSYSNVSPPTNAQPAAPG
jgi:hypothetical protein